MAVEDQDMWGRALQTMSYMWDECGDLLEPGDVLITLGAGDITKTAPAIMKALEERK